MPVDPELRKEYLAHLAAELGPDRVLNGSDILRRGPRGRIPFESPMLTWATTGGAAVGHLCRWYGPEGSGKSLSNWGLIGAGQRFPEIISQIYEVDIKWLEKVGRKLPAVRLKQQLKQLLERFPNGMDTIIFDTEGRIEADLGHRLGINMSRIEIVYDDIIESLCEKMADAMRAYHIVILDSASNAQSIAEATLEPGNDTRGSSPRMWSTFGKHVLRQMDRQVNTWIVVDQVRSQLGQASMRGTPVKPPQVRFFKHNASMALDFEQGHWLYLDNKGNLTDDKEKASTNYRALGTKDGKEIHGLEMKCMVEKNSTGVPFRHSRMRFQFPVGDRRTGELLQRVGWDEAFELVEMGTHFDIIDKKGSYYYLNDTKFKHVKGKTWQGTGQAQRGIVGDDALRERILHRAYRDMQPT